MTRRNLGILGAFLVAIAASVAAGSYIVGCIVLGVAIEIAVICSSFAHPSWEPTPPDEGDDEGGRGGWEPPDVPPDPWPPMSPEARDASLGDRVLTPA